MKFLLEWLPQVTVDLHEMGGDSQYDFPPAAAPNTVHTTHAAARLDADVRQGERRAVRRAGLPVLHPGSVRLLLSGLRRLVAVLLRLSRQDVRDGGQPRSLLSPERRHAAHLSRRRRAALHRGDPDRGDRRARIASGCCAISSTTIAPRSPKAAPVGVRAAAGQRSGARRTAGARSSSGTASRYAARTRPAKPAAATFQPAPSSSLSPSR